MPGSFDGKVVLVTGAAMGLGAGIAAAFAAEGGSRRPARPGRAGVERDGEADHRRRRPGRRDRRRRQQVGDGGTRGQTLVSEFGGPRRPGQQCRRRPLRRPAAVLRGGLGLRPGHQPQGHVPDVPLRDPRVPEARQGRDRERRLRAGVLEPSGRRGVLGLEGRGSWPSPGPSRSITRGKGSASTPSRRGAS